jgi:hypothetical protein
MVLENEDERRADMNIGTEERREQSHNIRNRGRISILRFPGHTFGVSSTLLHTLTNLSL